jgi:hypothetical protein
MADTTETSLRAQIAAHTSWANTTDRTARTSKARQALEAKFLREAEGDPTRAEHLRKAYYTRLALKSVAARRKARTLLSDAQAAEAEINRLGLAG